MIKSIENASVLLDGVGKTVKHEIRRQENGFLGMLLGTLGASMLRNMLTSKAFMRAGKGVPKAGTVYKAVDQIRKKF